MNKLFFLWSILHLIWCNSLQAQRASDSLYLQLNLTFEGKPLKKEISYRSKTDTLSLEVVKFYLSHIHFVTDKHDKIVAQKEYHLVDWDKPESLVIPISKERTIFVRDVIFDMGVDSTASVSGALGGDLDPANGMYWAWQSGYINLKLEGKSNSCKTRKNQFRFHLGGYKKPHTALRTVVLQPLRNDNIITVNIELSRFFNEIELSKTNSVMVPGDLTMKLSDLAVKMFTEP